MRQRGRRRRCGIRSGSKVHSSDGLAPVVYPSAFVHPRAVLIWTIEGTATYHELTRRGLATLGESVALREPEAGRGRLELPDIRPLAETRQR